MDVKSLVDEVGAEVEAETGVGVSLDGGFDNDWSRGVVDADEG